MFYNYFNAIYSALLLSIINEINALIAEACVSAKLKGLIESYTHCSDVNFIFQMTSERVESFQRYFNLSSLFPFHIILNCKFN